MFSRSAFGAWLTVAGFAALPAVARASDGEGAGGALPQMDAALYPGQIVWLVASFILLYLLVDRLIVPMVSRTKARRADALKADLDAAAAASEQATALQEKAETELASARASARAAVDKILASAQRESESRRAAQHKDLGKRLATATENVQRARDEALGRVRDEAPLLAQAVTDAVLGARTGRL